MHPAGIKFGLSNGLLQLSGADVIVSDELLESISAEARRQVRDIEPVTGTDIWDEVVHEGLSTLFERTDAPRQEVVPFFTGLDRILSETLMPLAKKAGIGLRIDRDFMIGTAFWDEFGERIRGLQLSHDMIEARKLFFRECCSTVSILCSQHDPDNARHADLLALFVFNNLNAAGALTILERLRTAKPRTHGN
jgi:hypothetical protein